jgi:hypothetical protein
LLTPDDFINTLLASPRIFRSIDLIENIMYVSAIRSGNDLFNFRAKGFVST